MDIAIANERDGAFGRTHGIRLSASIMVPPLGAPLEYHWRNLSREVAAEILKNPAFFTTERTNEYGYRGV
jgi:hypothetical protein